MPLQSVLDCIERVHGIRLSHDEVLEAARIETDRVIPDSISTVAQGTHGMRTEEEGSIQESPVPSQLDIDSEDNDHHIDE